jgi:hypothetical protein
MATDLVPATDLAPALPPGLTPEQRIEAWLDLLDACDEFLLAGLRLKFGPGGDVQAAYRQWYSEHMAEHDRTMQHLVEEFNRRSDKDGRRGRVAGA